MSNSPTPSARWVIKIGSSLLTDQDQGLNDTNLDTWVSQIAQLHQQNIECVLVSSGAVAAGINRLGWKQRPHALHELQAAAAVGQMGLIQAYESRLKTYQIHSAQILLTHDDLRDRQRYLNARSTLRTLLAHQVIPIVNENDTVATDEIRLGDNDTLGALVSNLIEADKLIILTDQAGLYDKNPRQHADATLIKQANAGDPQLTQAASGPAGKWGRGGMLTKIQAAQKAAHSGTTTFIANGTHPQVLIDIANDQNPGTRLTPQHQPLIARKQWLASQLQSQGILTLDAGATQAILQAGKSLLPIGVTHIKGVFSRGDVVICLNHQGQEIARGLANYSTTETKKIIGQTSANIENILGYVDEPELIHRDNLVITQT